MTDQQFAGLRPTDFIEDGLLIGNVCEAKLARRNIRYREPEAPLSPVRSAQEIISPRIQGILRGNRPRGDHADHLSLHDSLGEFWILYLLADGDLVAGIQEFLNVRLG
jgi:hypothetical protein